MIRLMLMCCVLAGCAAPLPGQQFELRQLQPDGSPKLRYSEYIVWESKWEICSATDGVKTLVWTCK